MKKLIMEFNKKVALKARQALLLRVVSMKSASLRISASLLAFAIGGAAVALAQEYGTSASPRLTRRQWRSRSRVHLRCCPHQRWSLQAPIMEPVGWRCGTAEQEASTSAVSSAPRRRRSFTGR